MTNLAHPFKILAAGAGARESIQFECMPGETLLRAGLRAGYGPSYECTSGGCGTCKLDLLDGEVLDLWPAAPGIRPRDRERNRHLACQSVPTTDCRVKLRFEPRCVPQHRPQAGAARLEAFRDVTGDIREFTFRGPSARFLPGQFALLKHAAAGHARAYSMSNIANDEGRWEFMVRRKPGGIFSNLLFELPVGAEVELDGPFGMAHLQAATPREIVCIGGGSGIGPMISILRGAVAAGAARPGRTWLFYGGRAPGDVPRLENFIRTEGIHWHPALSEPPGAATATWSGETGFVHELLPRKLSQPFSEYDFYFAGPPPMIDAILKLLASEHKVPEAQLHFDRFF
jgi:toluene monooxygenase electron transfer component